MKPAKHTPLPWKVDRVEYPGRKDVSFELVRTHHIASDKSRYFPREICQTIMREIKSEQALIDLDEANLALIVHRVNCHAVLLAVLQEVWNLLTPGQQGCAGIETKAITPVAIPYSTLAKIKAALVKSTEAR